MKKILPLFISLILITTFYHKGISQITLYEADVVPPIGKTLITHASDYMNPGISGANVTWDFSTLTDNGAATYTIVDPTTTINSASFPNATHATIGSSSTVAYVSSSPSGYAVEGFFMSNVVIAYHDPETYLQFPFTYNSSFVDNFASTFFNGIIFNRSGSITVTADGYGTLIMPYGTVNDVLRVKMIEVYQDDYNLGVPSTINYYTESYYWYALNSRGYSILSLSELTVDGSLFAQSAAYLDQTSVGIEEDFANRIDLNIYPNPTINNSTIEFDLQQSNHFKLSVSDILGNEIIYIEDELSNGHYNYPIDLENHPSGVYFVNIQIGNNTITKKIQRI